MAYPGIILAAAAFFALGFVIFGAVTASRVNLPHGYGNRSDEKPQRDQPQTNCIPKAIAPSQPRQVIVTCFCF